MKQAESNLWSDRRVSRSPTDLQFIRLPEVLQICGMSRSSTYEAIKEKSFPAPVKVHGRSSAWIRSEVQQWVQSRIRASRAS